MTTEGIYMDNITIITTFLGILDDTIEEEPNDESQESSVYEELNSDCLSEEAIDLKSIIGKQLLWHYKENEIEKLKIEEQLELMHPEIQRIYGEGIKLVINHKFTLN